MNLLSHILSRIVFVRAELLPDNGFCMTTFLWQHKKLAETGWEHAKGAPVFVIVCGHGVVTKPADSQIADRVKSAPETFLWSAEQEKISFVRRDRLPLLSEELATKKIVQAGICCAGDETDFETAAATCAAQFYETLKWRNLWRTSDEWSSVAQALVRRAALPLLGCLLALLAGNMLLSQRLNSRQQLLQTQYAARERTASDAASSDARQQQLLAAFAVRPKIPHAVICDRIAGAVPERVILTSLDIEPLTTRFEAGKPLQRRDGATLVCGLAPAAADISEFTQRLAEHFRNVRLTGVEKERDGARLTFQIELGL